MSASIQRRIDRLAKSCGIDFAAFDEAACPCARERFVPTMPTIIYGEDSWGFAVPLEPCPRCGRARADYSGVLWIQLAASDEDECQTTLLRNESITLVRRRR
jgi:hypothetical protein